jgi:hypothetical protein
MKKQIRFATAVAVLAAFALAAVLAVSPAGAGDKDDARELLEKSLDATGGEKAHKSWDTMLAKGELTVHWEGWGAPKADVTGWIKRPDKMVLDQDFSANDHPFFFTYYYNAGDVWAVVNMGVREHPRYTAFMTRSLKDAHGVHYYLTECDTMWVVSEVPDDSLVTGSAIDRVGIVDQGDTLFVDLDKKTHMPVRKVEDRGAQNTIYEAWHKAHGDFMRPYRVTVYQDGAVAAEYIWESFEFDVPMADGLFEEQRPEKKASN